MSDYSITNTVFENFPTPVYLAKHNNLIAIFEKDLFSGCQSATSGGGAYLTCKGGKFSRCCFFECSSKEQGHALNVDLPSNDRESPNQILECCFAQCSSEEGKTVVFCRNGVSNLEDTNFSFCRCANNVYYLYRAVDTSIGTRSTIANNTMTESSVVHVSEDYASHSKMIFVDNECLNPNSQHMYCAYQISMIISESVFYRNKSPHCLLGWKNNGPLTVTKCYIDVSNEVLPIKIDVTVQDMYTSPTELYFKHVNIEDCKVGCEISMPSYSKIILQNIILLLFFVKT